MLLTTTSIVPLLSRSPKAVPRPAFGVVAGAPRRSGHVVEPSAEVTVDHLALLVADFGADLPDLRVDVAVGEEDVEPAVVVEVGKARTPSEPARVEPETRLEGLVFTTPLPGIGVERRGVAGEVGLHDVQPPVAIEVADADAHAGLRLAVLAVRAAGSDADVFERAVVAVAVQRARVGVVGHVDVGPAVVVEVQRDDAEPVRPAGLGDPGAVRHVDERAVALVAIQQVLAARQSWRSARDRDALVPAQARVRRRRGREVEIDVVGDKQVQPAVAVDVEKGAAGAPSLPGRRQAARRRHLDERAAPGVVEQAVAPVVGHEQIVVAVVVVVADAGALTPSPLIAQPGGPVTSSKVPLPRFRYRCGRGSWPFGKPSSVVPLTRKMSSLPSAS